MTYHSSLPQTPGNHCSILCFCTSDYVICVGLPQGLSGKQSTCNAGAAGDVGSIPGSERSPGGEHDNHSSILAWRIPWTEETGRLQSIGLQRVGHNWSKLACMNMFYICVCVCVCVCGIKQFLSFMTDLFHLV